MKRTLSAMSIVMAIVLLTYMASPATAAKSRITLLNPPKGGVLELEVGESYTFNIEIASGPSFTLAMAMPDAYYPGRAIAWHGNDIAHGGNSAVLHLTMTGKGSTADFEAVCDWPEPGTCWPDGVVPASIVVGVRSNQGEVLSERFDFVVVVP
jgi:hypothetical protein